MVKRLFRTILWLVQAAIIVLGGLWLYRHPGQLQIDWQGQTLKTTVGFAGLVLVIFTFIFAVLYHLWRKLLAWPRLWSKQRHVKGLELGYRALNKGLLAIAAGDATQANKQAKKALQFLPDTALTHLLAAQAAQLAMDDVAADTHFAKLVQNPDGQLFGLRGQLQRALARDDRTESLRLARAAYQQQPTQPWIIDTAVQMESRHGHWLQAEKILRHALRHAVDKEGRNVERWQADLAAVLCALSDVARDKNELDAAIDCAKEAIKRHPKWSPAPVRLALLWQRKAYRRRAQKALLTAWEQAPHADLIAAWIHIMGAERGAGRATDNTATIERLVSANPDHAIAAMAMAEAFAKAGLWGVARHHAMRALEYGADRAVYRLLAMIERGDSNNTGLVTEWMNKASDAPLEPQWICSITHQVYPQ
jgi:HemY protein